MTTLGIVKFSRLDKALTAAENGSSDELGIYR